MKNLYRPVKKNNPALWKAAGTCLLLMLSKVEDIFTDREENRFLKLLAKPVQNVLNPAAACFSIVNAVNAGAAVFANYLPESQYHCPMLIAGKLSLSKNTSFLAGKAIYPDAARQNLIFIYSF